MFLIRRASCLCLLLALAGCSSKNEAVPESPAPTESPKISEDASLRPNYQMGREAVAAGTAFVIADKAGKLYMLTAAHIMDNDEEWQQVKGVSLRLMAGGETAKVVGRPLYLGKSFDAGDATADLVIWPLADGTKVTPLKLASADPKPNEWVWVIGQEPGSSGPQKMYRCKVTGKDSGGLMLVQHDTFQMRGFSGGPIINAQGEVVGNVLGSGGKNVISGPVSGIRQRLTQAKVELP